MLKPAWRILIVAALCVLTLIGLVVHEANARSTAAEIALPMEPVDPRSMLSGHYVIVNLREPLPPGEGCPAETGDTDWLALAPNGETIANTPIYALLSAAPTRAALPSIAQALPVRGGIFCSPPEAPREGAPERPGWLLYNLGVERYYTNQAEAERIQGIIGEQVIGEETRVYALLLVGRDGRARINGLIVDGTRIELGWL